MNRTKICLSLNSKDIDEIREELNRYIGFFDLIELRLDKVKGILDFSKDEYISFLNCFFKLTDKDVILKYQGSYMDEDRFITLGLDFPFAYYDISFDSPMRDKMVDFIKDKHKKVILSYHDFNSQNLSVDHIYEKLKEMDKIKCDILKLACFTTSDNMRDALNRFRMSNGSRDLICIAMGDQGRMSRLSHENYLTYGMGSKCTAEGQYSVKELKEYFK